MISNTQSTISNSQSRAKRGFTLVETLVAIAILMISISGPLAIANKALTAALYAKDQSTASFLAQEEMEIIKNIKANNIANNADWLASGLSSCKGTSCDFTVSPIPVTCSPSVCPLYITAVGYDHSPDYVNPNPTIFSRSFSLNDVGSGSCSAGSSGGTECQATVVVTWNEGTVQNAVTMSSELLDAP